jgi:hypothetical protein
MMGRPDEEDAMSITITDPALLAQFAAAEEVELKGPDGQVIGRFVAEYPGRLPPGVKSPFTDEQMADRRKQDRSGRPLTNVLRDLRVGR